MNDAGPPGVVVIFPRIRRNDRIPDLTIPATTEGELRAAIHDHVRPFMEDSNFRIELEGNGGWINAGIYNAGTFSIRDASRQDQASTASSGYPRSPLHADGSVHPAGEVRSSPVAYRSGSHRPCWPHRPPPW